MRKRVRKITAVMLTVVMMTLIIPVTTVTVSAGSVIESAISWAVNIANDDSHGYSQTSRWGPDYDCSSLVISAFKNAGASTGSASYTGNMISNFKANGFSWIPWSSIGNSSNLQRGDILLNIKYHTAIYMGNNQVVEAHARSAADKAYDNRAVGQARTLQGDQDGQEIRVTNYYWYSSGGWDGVLRYNDPLNNFPGEEDTSWDVPVWAYANCYSYTYNSAGIRESNHHIDEGDYCYVKKVYKNLYALVEYPLDSGGYREAYTSATAFTLYTKPIEPTHWYDGIAPVDLGTDFCAQIKNKTNGNLFTKEGNDVNGRKPNGDITQLWHFSRLDDGSYVIRSAENDWCLDVEAGDNLLDLNRQPSGTNVQVYGTYNGTGNQRFFIYYLFGAYYIRPVGMEKVVDLGIDSNLIAVCDYAENFAPQKFDIIKSDFNGYTPKNLGENFYAYIQNKKCQKVLTLGDSISSSATDVYGADNTNSISQIWNFKRLADGSYYIINLENNWYLDVEAGYNLNNISNQPDGTNIQTYSTYNGTDNQRFYIYRMYNSYYIRPVGTYRYVDMGINNGLVALWGYGEDFDPQKFDIIKTDLDGYFPTDLDNDFYAFIKNIKTQTLLTEKEILTANANNVSGEEANGTKAQIWHFIKNYDGSYTIQNEASKMYLDVDAGDNIDNLTAQPNGTNVTTYYKYNGTNNQKFLIYQIFDSYYIKPVGMNRIVDLALLTGDVAVWDYGRDFDPQKFDIIKVDLENLKIADITLDGTINIKDATALQKHLAGIETLTDEQLELADVNGDGRITVADVTTIQKFIAQLIDKF